MVLLAASALALAARLVPPRFVWGFLYLLLSFCSSTTMQATAAATPSPARGKKGSPARAGKRAAATKRTPRSAAKRSLGQAADTDGASVCLVLFDWVQPVLDRMVSCSSIDPHGVAGAERADCPKIE